MGVIGSVTGEVIAIGARLKELEGEVRRGNPSLSVPLREAAGQLERFLETRGAQSVEETARRYWLEEWGEDPSGPLYGRPANGSPVERWRSLSETDRQYYRDLVED